MFRALKDFIIWVVKFNTYANAIDPFELGLGKSQLVDFCHYPVEGAQLQSLVREVALLVHRPLDLDSKADIKSIPRTEE